MGKLGGEILFSHGGSGKTHAREERERGGAGLRGASGLGSNGGKRGVAIVGATYD